MKITGMVTKAVTAKGSKSEREAVFLSTSDGTYEIRAQGENPFELDVSKALAGKYMQLDGIRHGKLFIYTKFEDPNTRQQQGGDNE